MEHRYGNRVSVNLPMRFYRQGTPVAGGVVRNLSRYGIFIETDSKRVQKNQTYQVEILDHKSMWHRFDVVVAHKSSIGLGLEFIEESDAIVSTILSLDSRFQRSNFVL